MLTEKQMAGLHPHEGWDDGRRGFMWCRFDAVLCRRRRLRAEITFADNGDEDPCGPLRYYDPELVLESNCGGKAEGNVWRTFSSTVISLTDADAVILIESDPLHILTRYAACVVSLDMDIVVYTEEIRPAD